MKVLVAGQHSTPRDDPDYFAGWRGTCPICGAVVEVERGDAVRTTNTVKFPRSGNAHCPTTGCSSEIHVERAALRRIAAEETTVSVAERTGRALTALLRQRRLA